MKLSKEDFLSRVQKLIGEDTSEDALSTLEDFTDTYTELETANTGGENWEQKYKENDNSWRVKYRDRFFSGGGQEEQQQEEQEEQAKPITINDLFK